jgi:probable HAF family extracellular repeat protein
VPFPLNSAWTTRARRPLIAILAVAGTALAVTAVPGSARAATPQYKLTLSTVANSQYLKINNNGDILVGSEAALGSRFVLKAGSNTRLPLNPPASQASEDPLVIPESLNNTDQVVGESDTGDFTALEWPDSSTPTDLSQLPAIASTLDETQAPAINDNGLIAGYGEGFNGRNSFTQPFTIQNNVVTMLPELPNGVDAYPISASDAGVIAGDADTTTQDPRAVEWVRGAIKLLPSLPGTSTSEALAVNGTGEAVGAALLTSDLNAHAVLWANGKATDLGFAAGSDSDAEAQSINAGGVIVGDGDGHAFIYQNGTATDLNTLIPTGSGVTLTTAASINDHGVIVGTAVNAQGVDVGYELTPLS